MKLAIPVRAAAAVAVMLFALRAAAVCENPPLLTVNVVPHDDEGYSMAHITTEDVYKVQTFWDGSSSAGAITPSSAPEKDSWTHRLNRFCMSQPVEFKVEATGFS